MMLFVFGLLSMAAMAQDVTITGIIREKDGALLPGANIVVKGTTRGTQSDVNGTYKLIAPANSTLIYSFVGKNPQEVVVGNRTSIDVTLEDDAKSLTEVVVIGYGTQRKKDLTGSVAAISSKDFVQGQITNPEQLVAGKVAGVQITSNGGAPGSGSQIRIRGGSSLNANNDPLIVIDGVPVDNNGISGSPNPLGMINPNDIETMTVLKDASATAIYGSRASNGVILITTKKGVKGDRIRFNFSSQESLSKNYKQLNVLSADDFRALVNSKGTAAQKALMGKESTNWQDAIFQTGFTHDNNLSATGSLAGMPFRASVGYLGQKGILKTSDLGRTSGSLGISPMLFNNHLRIDVNLKGTIANSRFADQGAIGAAAFFDPTQPIYSGNNNFGGYFEWLDPSTKLPNTLATKNPVAILDLKQDKSTVKRSIGNAQFDYKFHFLPELRANLNLGYDVSSSEGTIYIPTFAGLQYARKGTNNQYSQTKTNKLLEFYLNYTKDLRSIASRIEVLGGYSYQDFIRESPAYPDVNAENVVISPAGIPFKTQNTLVSFYGRANYTLKDRYLVTFTLRDDGSSRFSPSTRWGLFPSAAFAWKIKEESFLRNSTVIQDLKLRLGYGVTGQQDVGSDYPYLARYTYGQSTAQYQLGNGFIQTLRPEGYDANLRWESTTTYNAGLDFSLFKGKLSGTIDVYQKKTKDLLSVIPVPAGSNLTNRILTNVGNLENRGIELGLNATPVSTDKFTWDANFNITYNENKITNLTKVPTPNDPGVLVGGISGGVGNTVQIHTVGYPTFAYYLYKQVYDANGKPIEGLYVDQDANGILNLADRYRYKSPNPKVYLGFSSNFTMDKFTVAFTLRGNIGNYVYNNINSGAGALQNVFNTNNYLSNVSSSVLSTNFQTNQYFSDYYLENASFLRMENLTVGYNVYQSKRANARLTAAAQNLFVLTKYSGLDPEIPGGIDNNFYPRPRTLTLGLNVSF
ncbi:SusC/RagA family protein [Arsenicibacter rosenii]|uniref:SusC/RagA family protein n=2 Tax=Arsenicibacter rosenii TaxID=1750698 RepID=A0A1S2VLA0_9BACT|nr:SusC/RagA family protein [Arsenicibacter rosenii]